MDTSSSLETTELLRHEHFVRRLALRLAHDEAGADDLVQETWMAALEGRPVEAGGLRSWLAGVVRNRAALARRRNQRRGFHERAGARTEALPPTAELVERVELHHHLVAEVLGLPEKYREAVLCSYFHGDSPEDTARRLGIPAATVRTRTRRALTLLRKRLRGPFETRHGTFLAGLGTLAAPGIGEGMAGAGTPALAPHLADALGWTTELVMKKTALHTSIWIAGFLGMGIGAGMGVGATHWLEGGPTNRGMAVPIHGANAVGEAPISLAPPSTSKELLAAPRRSLAPLSAESRPDSGPVGYSDVELRSLLFSENRLDQVRAIRYLAEASTPEANRLMLEAFLASEDWILLGLLEEALLASELNIAPEVMVAFEDAQDPKVVARLANMLSKLVEMRPGLEASVVALLVETFENPGPNGERLAGVTGALAALGVAAIDSVVDYLADPLSDPEGAGWAAHVLAELDASEAHLVRDKLQEGVGSLIEAFANEGLSGDELDAVRSKTQWMAWTGANRPPEEHDSLAAVFLDGLFRSGDSQQAQSLAWGLANLKGLSDETRLSSARAILDSLGDEPEGMLRQTHVWAVGQLAVFYDSRPLDDNFFQILELANQYSSSYGNDPGVSMQMQWLMEELRRYQYKREGR